MRRLVRIGRSGAEEIGVFVVKGVRIFAVVATFFLLSNPVAMANSLVATSPIAGSTLQSAPSAVTITAEVTLLDAGNEVTVTDPSGARVDDGTLMIAGTDAVVGLKPITQSGIYTVNYNLFADNDLPLSGKFTFNFSVPQVNATVAPEPSKPVTLSGNNLGTTIFVLGLLVAAIIVTILLARYARKLYNER